MGTGASVPPTHGVPLNPRVDYADNLSHKKRKPQLIDAPVLVRLDHGTVRYRYIDTPGDTAPKRERIEKPHEGGGVHRKKGYFYHAKLNDFSENAAREKEEEWKFKYVSRGPVKARQRRVYYVFGKGWDGSAPPGVAPLTANNSTVSLQRATPSGGGSLDTLPGQTEPYPMTTDELD